MWIRFGAFLIGLFFLSACAVVEPLSGGKRDENAPIPDLAKMSPQNGSTNFTGKEISIPFDEFFKLNNPSENIIVIPPDIEPSAKIKNKTLVLSWDDDLKPNTTYAFYLNGVVQDLNEKNDSLMSFVFSTGSFIDSLKTFVDARNAFSQSPQSEHTVGIYEAYSDSILPNYFGKTDDSGKVTLKYMKPGTYDLVTFNDLNKNLKPDKNEAFGFKLERLVLSDTIVDTNIILISPPKQVPKITTLKMIPPSTIIVGANRNLDRAKYLLNGEVLSDENIVVFSSDSVLLPFQWTDSANYELIIQADTWSDTSGFRMQEKDKNTELSLTKNKTEDVFFDEPIRFLSNHLISSLNVPSIKLINPKDSTDILLRRIKSLGSSIELDFIRKDEINEVEVVFSPSAIQSPTGTNDDTLKFKVKVLSQKEVGSLIVKLDGFSSAVVLDLLRKGNTVESIPLNNGVDSYEFKNLLPGEYAFRVTIDENENGRWDGGDWASKTLPEEVKLYPKPNRVRGNWDAEITLQADGI